MLIYNLQKKYVNSHNISKTWSKLLRANLSAFEDEV